MAGLSAPLLGLQKKSLREQALSALRTAITSGELEPGRHLVETELSEMLQISAVARCGRRCASWSRKASCPPDREADSPFAIWMKRRSGTSTRSAPHWNRWPHGAYVSCRTDRRSSIPCGEP
jgi:hypothetical protein